MVKNIIEPKEIKEQIKPEIKEKQCKYTLKYINDGDLYFATGKTKVKIIKGIVKLDDENIKDLLLSTEQFTLI